MSSKFVRDSILSFLQTEVPTENLIDLTAQFEEIQDLMDQYSLTLNDPWLGVQFVGSEETPVSIQSTNSAGCYREIGTIFLHVVAVSAIGVHNSILTRAENLRNAIRGRVINDEIYIEQVSPTNFGEGVTLNFESGYTAGAITVFYRRDLNL